jgi:hypothetical protein
MLQGRLQLLGQPPLGLGGDRRPEQAGHDRCIGLEALTWLLSHSRGLAE